MTNYEWTQLLKDCSIALNIPVFLINGHQKIICHYPDCFEKPPQRLRDIQKENIVESRHLPYTLQLFSDPYEQCVFLYPVESKKGEELVMGIGPFLQHKIERKQVKKYLIMNNLDLKDEQTWFHYFQQLPIMNQVQFLAVERLLHDILPKQDQPDQPENKEDHSIRKAYQQYTQSLSSYSTTVSTKQTFLHFFKKGEGACIDMYQLYKKEALSFQTKSLREEKNQLIRLITELSYICITNGSQSEEVLSMSDFYVNFLETKNSVEELQILENNVLHSFLERVRIGNHQRISSPLVERARRYIFQNLTAPLTLKRIAEELNVHPNYLSGVFAKETGVSLMNFINQQRVKEAKELLSITNYSLMEISILLGYNSQSYFTRVFKNIEGLGPKEFRKKYHVYKE